MLLAQFGWNYSQQLNVALCKGAATMQNKDWGVIITWTYTEPPYIESGEELYKHLILAYENGAKYIVVFDSNKNYTQGILKEDQLNALKQFWRYVQDNPRESDPISIESRTCFRRIMRMVFAGQLTGFRNCGEQTLIPAHSAKNSIA